MLPKQHHAPEGSSLQVIELEQRAFIQTAVLRLALGSASAAELALFWACERDETAHRK